MIVKKPRMIGSSLGPVWHDNFIGIADPPAPPVPIPITSYRLAYKTDDEMTFNYVEGNNFVTVFDGAVMYINPPPGIILPMTVISSDPSIAEVGAGAMITWHKAGAVTLTATDQYGNEAIAMFSPSLFFVSSKRGGTMTENLEWADSVGARLAEAAELSSDSGRKIGALYDEWGSTLSVQGMSDTSNLYTMSATVGASPDSNRAVNMSIGHIVEGSNEVPDGNTLGILLT